MIKNPITYLHNGTIGDVWASIPAMKQQYEAEGNKAILFLVNGQVGTFYKGATHPTRNKDGKMVMLNEQVINMMIPLLKQQEFIQDVRIWNGEPVQVDLNLIRERFINMPNGCISRWYFYVFPDLACDLSKIWLTVPDSGKDLAKEKIIITRTERYTNTETDYSFLKNYQKDILFCGTQLEYEIFKHRFGLLDIGRLVINDFLELAQALKQCKFHLSNQTQAFQLSQGLKIPRIVELCDYAPNVIPIGENAFDFYGQDQLEYYFHRLNGTLTLFMNALRLRELTKKPAEAGWNK